MRKKSDKSGQGSRRGRPKSRARNFGSVWSVDWDAEQRNVMDYARRVPPGERKLASGFLRAALLNPDMGIGLKRRAAQVGAAWLGGTLPIIVEALRLGDGETKFAVLCSLTDAEPRAIRSVSSQLAEAAWWAAAVADDTDVQFMAARLLSRLDRRTLANFLMRAHLSQSPRFLLARLAKFLRRGAARRMIVDELRGRSMSVHEETQALEP